MIHRTRPSPPKNLNTLGRPPHRLWLPQREYSSLELLVGLCYTFAFSFEQLRVGFGDCCLLYFKFILRGDFYGSEGLRTQLHLSLCLSVVVLFVLVSAAQKGCSWFVQNRHLHTRSAKYPRRRRRAVQHASAPGRTPRAGKVLSMAPDSFCDNIRNARQTPSVSMPVGRF